MVGYLVAQQAGPVEPLALTELTDRYSCTRKFGHPCAAATLLAISLQIFQKIPLKCESGPSMNGLTYLK